MPSYKAEAYARILNEAKDAKPLEGKKNVYSPEEYNKVMQAERFLSNLNQGGEWITAQTSPGDVEFDEYGHLKKIGRAKPAMLPVEVYTMNRYLLDVHEEEQKYTTTDKDGKVEEKTRTKKITDILVAMGQPIVQAISQTHELPPTVTVFRFRKNQAGNWKFIKAEFVKSEVCYSMTKTLSAEAMLKLINEMDEAKTKATNNMGDSLEDIA